MTTENFYTVTPDRGSELSIHHGAGRRLLLPYADLQHALLAPDGLPTLRLVFGRFEVHIHHRRPASPSPSAATGSGGDGRGPATRARVPVPPLPRGPEPSSLVSVLELEAGPPPRGDSRTTVPPETPADLARFGKDQAVGRPAHPGAARPPAGQNLNSLWNDLQARRVQGLFHSPQEGVEVDVHEIVTTSEGVQLVAL